MKPRTQARSWDYPSQLPIPHTPSSPGGGDTMPGRKVSRIRGGMDQAW